MPKHETSPKHKISPKQTGFCRNEISPQRDFAEVRFDVKFCWNEISPKQDFVEIRLFKTRFWRNTISLKQDLAEKKKRWSDKKPLAAHRLFILQLDLFLLYTDRKWIYAEYKITAQWKFKVEGQLCNTRAIPIDYYNFQPQPWNTRATPIDYYNFQPQPCNTRAIPIY